jgi:hypothetical protein
LNPAGLKDRSLGLGESAKPMRCQPHLGGQLEFSLNTNKCAVFFFGVSRSRLNISISALLFFVPNKSENHAHISGGSLRYRVGQVRILKRSILRDAVLVNQFWQLYFVVAQAAGVVSLIATAQQKVQVVRFAHWDAHKAARPITKMLAGRIVYATTW